VAVPLEFANVVLHKERVEAIAIGTLDRIAASSPPNWAEDEQLVRVGFMSTSEADALIDAFLPSATASLAAVVGLGLAEPPDWITIGAVDERAAAWLTGSPAGALVQPVGCASLHEIRSGVTWDDIETALARGGIACTATETPQRLLHRDPAVCHIDLFDGPDGKVVVMLSQSTARRTLFAANSKLLAEVLDIISSAFDGRPL